MAEIRELLAVVAGAALGVAFLTAPRTMLRLSVFVGPTRRRREEYGTDNVISPRWVWLARGIGIACLSVATFLIYQMLI
jgi:hypothetical protein